MSLNDEPYDRMSPEWSELVWRLQAYAKLDYGAQAYSLSTAESKLILQYIAYTQPFIKYETEKFEKIGNG